MLVLSSPVSFLEKINYGEYDEILIIFESTTTVWLFNINSGSLINEYTPGHSQLILGAKAKYVFFYYNKFINQDSPLGNIVVSYS